MSHINTHTLTCPHCGKSAAQTVWDSVNVTLEPDVKERILAGHFFEFFCLDCGYHAPLLHPCLYHDMEQKLLIWYLPDGLEPEQAQQAVAALEPVRQALEPGYRLRRVPSRGRLAEKIRLFDRGLDDRVVELCKAVLLCQQSQLTPEELFYQPLEDGSDGIVFTARPPAAYPLTEALRQAVETRFAPLLARPEEETFAAIDAAWALEQLAAQS